MSMTDTKQGRKDGDASTHEGVAVARARAAVDSSYNQRDPGESVAEALAHKMMMMIGNIKDTHA